MQLSSLVQSIVSFYEFCIIAYVIMSWFRPTGIFYDIYRVLGQICEPYIGIFRKIVPQMGGFDFSAIVAILVLRLLTNLIFS
jgi:uncharacterized protein YggT (Ycf19 family)